MDIFGYKNTKWHCCELNCVLECFEYSSDVDLYVFLEVYCESGFLSIKCIFKFLSILSCILVLLVI